MVRLPSSVSSVAVMLSIVLLQTLPKTAAAADAQQAAAAARVLAGHVGINRGLCVVVGQDPDVVIELVESTELTVLVREPDAKRLARLQQAANEAGLEIDRLVIQSGNPRRLPYADRMIDAVFTATRCASFQ